MSNTDSNDNSNNNTNSNTSADALNTLLSAYKTMAPETPFKKQLVIEFETFYNHYTDRMLYVAQEKEYEDMKNEAGNLCRAATQCYRSQQYDAAANLFFNALKISTHSYLKNQKELATAYYNCGRSNYQSGQYKLARFFIDTALILHQNYLESSDPEIEKIKSALQECDDKLEETNENENENHVGPN